MITKTGLLKPVCRKSNYKLNNPRKIAKAQAGGVNRLGLRARDVSIGNEKNIT